MAGRQRTRLAAAGMSVLIIIGCGPTGDGGVKAQLSEEYEALLEGIVPCMNAGLEASEIAELNAHDVGWAMGDDLYAAYVAAMSDCQEPAPRG